jgi:hypothetical protein
VRTRTFLVALFSPLLIVFLSVQNSASKYFRFLFFHWLENREPIRFCTLAVRPVTVLAQFYANLLQNALRSCNRLCALVKLPASSKFLNGSSELRVED